MKAAKYREKSTEELEEHIEQLRRDLFYMRVGNTTKELQNTNQIPETRRELARVLTVLNQKKREA